MGFALSLSGLNGAARAIDVIGNNIANAETVGFKASRARFADVMAAVQTGVDSDNDVGAGVSTAIIRQQFTQGNLAVSDNPLDMAITGLGFFRLDTAGTITYTRNGQFRAVLDADNMDRMLLENLHGSSVTGFPASYGTDPLGTIDATAAPEGIAIDVTMPAAATTAVALSAVLDSRDAAPLVAFDASDPLSYNATTKATVFDSAGGSHQFDMYFVRSVPGSAWNLYTRLDGGAATGPVALAFDTYGQLQTPMPLAGQTHAYAGGSLELTLDLSGVVQYGRAFAVQTATQDGYGVGTISGVNAFSVGADGVIQAYYSNGQTRNVAQLVLANFVNPDALISLGDGQWTENADPTMGTGTVTLGTAGRESADGLGALQGAVTERSNVDLSVELVSLIEQQRNYQASAQTFKILDQVLQNLANVR